MYLSNVSKSLKKKGRFIGTCLDGSKVFNELKTVNEISNYDGDTMCWKISKKYTNKKFTQNEKSLGLEIDVYNESIGITFKEYLVNLNYLVSLCSKHNLKLVEVSSFESLFDNLSSIDYGDILKMTDDLKKYSFMNSYFIFEKQ